MWNITNDVRHADKAMEILRGYAGTLQKIHGPDDPLCAGLQGFMLINAAEIMRYTYSSEGFPKGGPMKIHIWWSGCCAVRFFPC